MHKFLHGLVTQWRKLELPVKNETFIIAVSGGADSVSLLLALAGLKQKKKLDLEFIVAHFDHDLRGAESDRDEKFVRKLSEKLGFGFESAKWKVKKNHNSGKSNLEQAARLARYEFLEKTAGKFGAYGVLTGHTVDDQAETFLLRLVRGSGIDGLAAMKPVRELSEGKKIVLVRPLLSWARRADTEEFCRAENVKYRNDRMNRDEAFLRVKVRKKLIPLLENLNPGIVPNLAKISDILQQEMDELEAAAQEIFNRVFTANEDTIDVKGLREVSAAKRKRVLRIWLRGLRGGLRRLDMEHFAALERLILSPAGGKTAELPGGESVTLKKGKLIFRKTKVEKSRTDN
jgi:tRNA(Ile)-lysidine synthase